MTRSMLVIVIAIALLLLIVLCDFVEAEPTRSLVLGNATVSRSHLVVIQIKQKTPPVSISVSSGFLRTL